MLDSNVYAVIGLYLTLAGLLGTFFYVHLSSWLQDLLRLKAKWDANKPGTDSAQLASIRECRFELRGLYNHIPVMVFVGVSSFVVLLSRDSLELIGGAPQDPLAQRLQRMLFWFLSLYFVMSIYLLGRGLYLGHAIAKESKPKP